MLKQKEVEELKARYPKGTQIELEEMRGEDRMQSGLKGVVQGVDDIGQIHVSWENGSCLALNTEEDTFHVMKPEMKSYEKKMNAFLEKINETLEGVNLFSLNISTDGQDKQLAHDTLKKMQEAFEEVYGPEPISEQEEYILAPAVFRGRKSEVTALGLVVLDLQSAGEHCESTFFTPKGIMHQSDMEENPNIKSYLKEHFIPYDYWYTPAIGNDIHTDFCNIPENVKELAGELFQNQQQGGPAMTME